MRIVLADDHPIVRSGMVQVLAELYPHAVIEEAGDASALSLLLEKAPQPDLIVADLLFPGFDYMRDLKAMRQRFSLCPIIAVSMMNDPVEINHIMGLGMNGFISKSVASSEMIQAIRNVMDGMIEVCISDAILSHDGGHNSHHTPLQELTPRQIEILKLLRHGLSNKEIARELDLSPFTVRSHVSALMKNLGVSNRAAASAIAASYGLT